jgi:hypothetical protein
VWETAIDGSLFKFECIERIKGGKKRQEKEEEEEE